MRSRLVHGTPGQVGWGMTKGEGGCLDAKSLPQQPPSP
ncbi:MAG: hypothetical protein QOJ51_4132, partial [Acidobacteriaceae bacterium]|nr:hypothetical protein [Acidobacteriaceae bacterium]